MVGDHDIPGHLKPRWMESRFQRTLWVISAQSPEEADVWGTGFGSDLPQV